MYMKRTARNAIYAGTALYDALHSIDYAHLVQGGAIEWPDAERVVAISTAFAPDAFRDIRDLLAYIEASNADTADTASNADTTNIAHIVSRAFDKLDVDTIVFAAADVAVMCGADHDTTERQSLCEAFGRLMRDIRRYRFEPGPRPSFTYAREESIRYQLLELASRRALYARLNGRLAIGLLRECAALANLHTLTLAGHAIADRDFAEIALAAMPALRRLDVSGNRVRDIRFVAGLRLEHLDIGRNPIAIADAAERDATVAAIVASGAGSLAVSRILPAASATYAAEDAAENHMYLGWNLRAHTRSRERNCAMPRSSRMYARSSRPRSRPCNRAHSVSSGMSSTTARPRRSRPPRSRSCTPAVTRSNRSRCGTRTPRYATWT